MQIWFNNDLSITNCNTQICYRYLISKYFSIVLSGIFVLFYIHVNDITNLLYYLMLKINEKILANTALKEI